MIDWVVFGCGNRAEGGDDEWFEGRYACGYCCYTT